MPTEVSDSELLVLAGAGGPAAVEAELELCRRFGPRVRLYGLRHLRDDERARDLVQTVLLGVLEAARNGRIRQPEQLARFVLGTCRNVVLRMKEIDSRAESLLPEVLAVAAGTERPRDRVDAAVLVRCLHQLQERARLVLELSFHEELSTEEIAGRLELTGGNVRVIRHRALAALRKCLDTPLEVRS